jgi:hypothetical protein
MLHPYNNYNSVPYRLDAEIQALPCKIELLLI